MKTSFSDDMEFSQWCEKAKGNPEELKNFRNNPLYSSVVPKMHSEQNSIKMLTNLQTFYPHLLDGVLMDKFLKKQDFGNPPKFEYEGYGMVDPMVFRFIFVFGRIVENLGPLDGLSICEIGPGNGLLFKIITDVYPDVKYTFIDLEGPMWFLQKNVEYYERMGNVKEFIGCGEVMKQEFFREGYDIVISECAFNECYLDTQMAYMEKILNRSAWGRILCDDSLWSINNRNEPHLDHKGIYDLLKHKKKWIYEDGYTGQAIFWKPEE
jgi:hypothetical protein